MLLDQDAADLRPPANLRLRLRHAEQVVTAGLVNNGREQFVLAALEYQSILADPDFDADDDYYSDIEASLGALFCLIAQTEQPGPKRLHYLARAQTLLGKALNRCQKTATPLAWARTRANLSIVLLTQYEQTSASEDLFTGLMTLDGVAEVFAHAGDFEAEGWVHSIGRRLDDLRNARR
ncbi:MAG: hypothetical protein JWR51_2084 [Devosia sp.]|uniref:hypothetical protein n=1 Tax=Devosia sp. TaxID=1871048 RepID=UPI00262FEEAF|nr:hypothetical protein [Devosia sp.]MDB5528981.1 hypothetical protein [Devosia sp.]